MKTYRREKIRFLPFPKLMISSETGIIVLATNVNNGYLSGTIVDTGKNSNVTIGTYRETLVAEYFSDYKGEVTLLND